MFIRQWRTQILPAMVLVFVVNSVAGIEMNNLWAKVAQVAQVAVAVVFVALVVRAAVLYRSMKADHSD